MPRRTRAGHGQGSYTLEVTGARETLRAFDRLGRDASKDLRDASARIGREVKAELLTAAAMAPSPQAALVAKSITVRRDRIVRVDIGGPKKVGRAYRSAIKRLKSGRGKQVRASAGALLWGSETGSRSGADRAGRAYTDRFKAPRDHGGHWIGPTVEKVAPRAYRAWLVEVDRLLGKWGSHG